DGNLESHFVLTHSRRRAGKSGAPHASRRPIRWPYCAGPRGRHWKISRPRAHPGADDYWMHIELPAELQRYTIFKGSLAVEGISLTVANIESSKVTIALIPHTWEMTNLKSL